MVNYTSQSSDEQAPSYLRSWASSLFPTCSSLGIFPHLTCNSYSKQQLSTVALSLSLSYLCHLSKVCFPFLLQSLVTRSKMTHLRLRKSSFTSLIQLNLSLHVLTMATEKQGQICVKGCKIPTTAAKERESHCKLNSTAVKTKVRGFKGRTAGYRRQLAKCRWNTGITGRAVRKRKITEPVSRE